MSSNRLIVLLAGVGLLAGCAVQNPRPAESIITPTQQFAPKVESAPFGILLKAGAPELSVNQKVAVVGLVRDWRQNGSGVIVVEAPSAGGDAGRRTASRVGAELQALGVSGGQVSISQYEAAADAPVRVSFLRNQVEQLSCGEMMSDYTATLENKPFSNFGCAVTSNFAAMLANPADLTTPRAEEPLDAGRRQVMLDKYRAGQPTASAKDSAANASISNAVN